MLEVGDIILEEILKIVNRINATYFNCNCLFLRVEIGVVRGKLFNLMMGVESNL